MTYRGIAIVLGVLGMASACGSSSKGSGTGGQSGQGAGGSGGSGGSGGLAGTGGPGGSGAGGTAGSSPDAGAPDSARPDGMSPGGADGGGSDAVTVDAGAPDAAPVIRGKDVIFTACPVGTVGAGARAIATVPNGIIAVVKLSDTAAVLERYLGQGCSLTKDAAYRPAAAPVLDTQVATDSRGHAYFGSMGSTLETIELDAAGTLVQRYVQPAVDLAVTADGLTLYSSVVGNPVRSKRSAVGGMFSLDPAYPGAPLQFTGAIMARAGGASLIGGRVELNMPYHVFAVNDAAMITDKYGSDKLNDPDALCHTESLATCGSAGSFCVADFNCPRVLVFDGAGKHKDGFAFMDGRQPLSLAALPNGTLYLLHSSADPTGPSMLGLVSGIP